ncbi:MAG: PH domain-containing protein [Ruminococcus sp.]|nr:PH domain-containing protein [Ruminococcus sp.]
MKIYKTSKRPLVLIYVLLLLFLLLIKYALNLVTRFIPFTDYYVLLPLWIVVALFAVLVLPFYFHKCRFTVSSKEITAKGGLIITSKHFMLTEAVKSVTTVITPLSGLTGLNFVVLNTLGAKLMMPFLSKRDALEITAAINNTIRRRKIN